MAGIIIAEIIIARGMEIIIIAIMAHINKTDIAMAMSAEGLMSAEKEEGAKRFASLLERLLRLAESITSLPLKNSLVLYYAPTLFVKYLCNFV